VTARGLAIRSGNRHQRSSAIHTETIIYVGSAGNGRALGVFQTHLTEEKVLSEKEADLELKGLIGKAKPKECTWSRAKGAEKAIRRPAIPEIDSG